MVVWSCAHTFFTEIEGPRRRVWPVPEAEPGMAPVEVPLDSLEELFVLILDRGRNAADFVNLPRLEKPQEPCHHIVVVQDKFEVPFRLARAEKVAEQLKPVEAAQEADPLRLTEPPDCQRRAEVAKHDGGKTPQQGANDAQIETRDASEILDGACLQGDVGP